MLSPFTSTQQRPPGTTRGRCRTYPKYAKGDPAPVSGAAGIGGMLVGIEPSMTWVVATCAAFSLESVNWESGGWGCNELPTRTSTAQKARHCLPLSRVSPGLWLFGCYSLSRDLLGFGSAHFGTVTCRSRAWCPGKGEEVGGKRETVHCSTVECNGNTRHASAPAVVAARCGIF